MTARRAFLKWLGAVPVLPAALPGASRAAAKDAGRGHVRLEDDRIGLQFDDAMRCRVVRKGGARMQALTRFDASAWLAVKDRKIERFTLASAVPATGSTPFGAGRSLQLVGRSSDGLEKQVTVTVLDAWPGTALVDVAYVNRGARALDVVGCTSVSHRLLAAPRHAGGYWTYSGATHRDRRNWAQPVQRGFDQRNFMGMNASDYGGGTPVVDVWRRDVGFAVGHLDLLPQLVALPVRAVGDEVDVALIDETPRSLATGETLRLPLSFISVHEGDFFVPLDRYRQMMDGRGIRAPKPPASAYEPVWCAWGYEREFSFPLVRATLPKIQALGLKWVVMDDGWQVRTGDWRPDPAKFPGGDADMKAFVDEIHARGLLARLWIAPLAVAPGSDELHDHPDMLLLDADGAPQLVTWWNSFYLCPSYAKTQQRMAALIRKIIGEWGFDGLKVDGQHLNGVAPCFNPAHHHAHPEDSTQHLTDFYRVLHETVHAVKPEAVVEVCPCGTGYAFHNMPYIDQAPASDPESSWQVRHKGKTLKALMGPSAAYAGDHVELSTGGQDFASAVGVGGVVSTKFTWPVDPKPKDSFLLTPAKEAHWRKWIGAYNTHRLAEGRYRGELYDIAFDKPETHVVEKDGVLHYAFFSDDWDGPVTLRGLGPGDWIVEDYVEGRVLGTIRSAVPRIAVRFKGNLLVRARPITGSPRTAA
jgi:alpha-galactosidase